MERQENAVITLALRQAWDQGKDGRALAPDTASAVVEALRAAEFEIVPTPDDEPLPELGEICLSVGYGQTPLPYMPEGSAARVGGARRTGDWSGVSVAETPVVLERGRAVEMPPGTTFSAPPADSDEGEAPERDSWGVRACLADDTAARHGCRVELSGIDNPHMPLTPVDDMTAYAVVTERVSGRLVGIVECWQSEDGDYIVPKTWLEITLSAWDAESTPMRAA